NPNTSSAYLVFVAWANPPAGGANRAPALAFFAGQVERTVIGHDDMGVKADQQIVGRYAQARFLEAVHFLYQHAGIEHHSVSNHALLVLMKNSGGEQVEDMLLPVYYQRVPRIVSALEPDNEIRLLRKQIDNLAFSLIAPLSAHYNYVRHIVFFPLSHIVRRSPGPGAKISLQYFQLKDRRNDRPVGFRKPDSSLYL